MRVLIVEDDASHAQSLRDAIEGMGWDADCAPNGREALARIRDAEPDVALVDLVLPDIDGIEVMGHLLELSGGRLPVLMMTAYASVETSVRAMQRGAYDYLLKPLDLPDLRRKLERAAEAARLRRQVDALHAEARRGWSARTWVAESPAMRRLVAETLSLAPTTATVLVQGESGTGKELVARALHADSPRAAGPFVAVNCAAFPENLLESELFGHEKGAFTGALARHAGAFERADGGTLFLDEIGDASPAVQAKLLRVLEDREVLRVGGQTPFRVDVRLVAATNRDLEAAVKDGSFRQDLFWRLRVIGIALPPLRERPEDIRPLAERFAAVAQKEHGRPVRAVEPAWFERLQAWTWPGNVRELRNTVEAAVILAHDGVLRAAALRIPDGRPVELFPPLPAPLTAPSPPSEPPPSPAPAPQEAPGEWHAPAGLRWEEIERRVLADTLRRHHGNRAATAAELGLSVRTVQRKIADYSLEG